ncbi:MAG: DUF1573 domain-containing protein [Phycisphaerales bacterium]|nr:MAG: DUF1573 domain-containing protein [Phycisphaerales bacterium]
MKRYRLSWPSVALALLALLQTGCREPAGMPDSSAAGIDRDTAETVPQAPQPAPRIAFEQTVYDFGDVGPGGKYTGRFTFTNAGDAPLRISDVKKCCGAVVTLDKKELAPGQSGTLEVQYRSGRGSGMVRKQLHISSNDETNPKVTLTIRARIVPKVAYTPRRIYLLLDGENAGCPEITLTSLDEQPFSIKSFTSTGNSITADIDPAVEATKFVLRPRVDIEKLERRSAGLVSIGLTHPELGRVTVYFSTRQRFKTTPASIILFNPEPQKPTVKKISVVSNYGREFEIESTSSEKGLVKVLSQERTDKGYRLEVEVTPPARDDTGRFSDMLHLHLDNAEKLSVKCYGRYGELKQRFGLP